MLSRVADSLYWMSRYFERADNAARVLKATYGLILNPAKFSTEERWFRAVSSWPRVQRPATSIRSVLCFCWWQIRKVLFQL